MSATAVNAKLTVLVTPATKRRLEAEARARKTTVGDLVRRRLDGEPEGEERLFVAALADLGRRSAAMIAELDATRAALEQDGATWAEREAEIRRTTLAGLTDADRTALAVLIPARHDAQRGTRA